MTEPTIPAATIPPEPPPVRNAEFKAAMLLVLMFVLVVGSVLYLMYARGAFESTQRLVLQADDSDGVSVGMDVTFAGFPIGRVRSIELGDDGKERILVGGAKLRAFTGLPTDPPLPDGAARALLVGDAGAEIPHLLSAAKDLLQNLTTLTATDSALDASLHNVEGVTGKLNGPSGAMGLIAGDDKEAQKLLARANQLVTTMNELAHKTDSLIGNADRRVFGKDGVMTDTH